MENPFIEFEDVQEVKGENWFFELMQTAVIALAICIILWLFVVQGNEVDGQSMEPTFHDGQLVLTDKIIQRFGDYQRGDVIIFKNIDTNSDFIKRIIGIGGDKVMIKEGNVFVNGTMLDESYLPEGRKTSPGTFIAEGETITIPENKFFVMGDNRGSSKDSRDNHVALVDRKDLKGRVFIIYWPLSSDNLGVVDRLKYNLD